MGLGIWALEAVERRGAEAGGAGGRGQGAPPQALLLPADSGLRWSHTVLISPVRKCAH